MIRRLLLPGLVLGVGLTIIAAIGVAMIDRNVDADRRARQATLESVARESAAHWRAQLESRVVELRDDPTLAEWTLVAHADGRFEPVGWSVATDDSVDDEELAYFETSLAGGDVYAAREEYGRAMDAYSFALPLLESEELRDRLRLRLGRVALTRFVAEGDPLDRGLGTRLLNELIDRPSTARDQRMPIAWLARFALASHGIPGRLPAPEEFARAIAALPLPVAESIARRLSAEASPVLEAALERRRDIERRIREAWSRLWAGHAVYLLGEESDRVVVPLALESGSRGARSQVPLTIATATRPSTSAPNPYQVTVAALPASNARAALPREAGVARAEVELDGAPVLVLTAVDREHASASGRLARKEIGLKVGLIAILSVVGVALLTTWAAIDRQRRLAEVKVRLLANVSHELKTPVTSIRMLGELLADPDLPRERTERFAQLVTREAKRLGRRIEDILETARDPGQRRPLELRPIDVVAVTAEVVEGFRQRADEQGVALHFESPVASLVVPGDEGAVERIVENLVDNAFKYGVTPADSAAPEVRVSIAPGADAVELSVTDRGPGVPTEDRQRIFDAFYRVAFQDYGVPGTGLGLAISRSLARRLGGKLEHGVRSGGGSRFTLSLPRPTCDDPAPTSAESAASRAKSETEPSTGRPA